MKIRQTTDIPNNPISWISEISAAYRDAYEAIPFGALLGQRISEKDLFHMTPEICLKFRGIKRTKANAKQATEAMLASYVATEDQTEGIFDNPHLTFAFGYLVSHYGMGILREDEITGIMEYLGVNQLSLKESIENHIRNRE